MAERTGTCEDCATVFVAGSRGAVPKRCVDCTAENRRVYFQQWGAARLPREKTKVVLACGDCRDEFLWTVVGGPLPDTCGECAKERRREASRERGRLKRLAAKAGDIQRRNVCMDCFTEFIAPPRGSLPRRCPECTEQWEKIRHTFSGSRTETSRRYNLLTKYGMTPEEWQEMYDRQGGSCAICKRTAEEMVGGLHVDHCHSSGVIRGLLCSPCNTSIGKLQEDPAIIRAAADYVEWHALVRPIETQ